MLRLKFSEQGWRNLPGILPVVTAVFITLFIRLQGEVTADAKEHLMPGQGWALYWPAMLELMLHSVPLMLSQYLAHCTGGWRRYLILLLGFVAYPTALILIDPLIADEAVSPVSPGFWFLVAGLSLLYWLHLAYQQRFSQQVKQSWMRHLISLDAALLVVLLVWAWVMTGFFVNTPDPMRNQPLEPVVDIMQMLANWPLTLSYYVQFLCLAAVIYCYYWINRYVLIRKVLPQHGVYLYLLTSALWLLLSYPLFAYLVLQLPLNIPEQTLLPSENQNPFDGMNLFVGTMIWALSTPFILAFERQQSAKELAELQQGQVQAELKMLQQQVNPHFLFNTLNSLYALCLTRSENAAPMLLKLSDLLRYAVYQGQKSRVPLADDLDCLQNYMQLQRMRIGSRCHIQISIETPAKELQIAPMLLIMLVENAFKHGIEPSDKNSDIDLTVTLSGDELIFCCSNSLGPESSVKITSGIGLSNMQRRLDLTYPGRHSLSYGRTGDRWMAALRISL